MLVEMSSIRPGSFIWSFFFSLFCVANAVSADYYISSTDGDDRFDGRSGGGVDGSGPFETLKRLELLRLKDGDRILLKCGDRFSGDAKLRFSMAWNDLVKIEGYGPCDSERRPVIDGRRKFSSSGTSSVIRQKTSSPIELVFVDGEPLPTARFPKAGYLIVPDGFSPKLESVPLLPALNGRELNGALIQARTQEWYIESRLIISPDGRLDSPLRYPIRPKAGFYLTGKGWMVEGGRGWAYDAFNEELFVSVPRSAVVEIVPRGNLLEISGGGSVQISGIDFNASGADGVKVGLDGVVTITNTSVRNAAANGISVSGARLFVLFDSMIRLTGLDGVFLGEVKKAHVARNHVFGAGMLGHPSGSLAAINAHRVDSATVSENVVIESAYHGIRFAGDARILRNYVAKSCRRLSDCGAIYTWRRDYQDERPLAEVFGNFVSDVSGDVSVKFGVNDWFAGIYIDDFSNNIEVSGNVVLGANQGIYLHNSRLVGVVGNFVQARNFSILEKVDAERVGGGGFRNRIDDNYSFVGDFVYSVRRRDGVVDIFSHEDLSGSEVILSPSLAGLKENKKGGECQKGAVFSLREGRNSAFPLVRNVRCN